MNNFTGAKLASFPLFSLSPSFQHADPGSGEASLMNAISPSFYDDIKKYVYT